MPLVAMGELLRAGRQKRGLSVEEIAAQLKISPRLIRDLEMGNEPALPHAVYVRGFIKSYAKLLDINPDDLAPGLAVYEREEEVALPPPPRSGGGLLVLAVLCALAFAGYWYYNTYFMPARQAQSSEIPATRSEPVRPALESAPQPAPGPPAAPVSQPAPPAPASQAPVPVAAPVIAAQPSPAAGEGTDLPDVMETAGEEAQVLLSSFRAPEREMPVTGSGRGITVNLGVPGGGALPVNQLVLTGMAECWVHATADETDTREFSIRPDETFSLSFSKTLVIKLGNAGGVRLKYNGVNLPAPGKDGQVMTLSFPEAGSG